jgi:flagellar protein FlaH
MLGLTTTNDPGTSGFKEIAEALGGGFKEGSFVVLEGEAKTGKSILCQHITYGVLNTHNAAVAYYSSDYNTDGLTVQMNSMNLDITEELKRDQLRVYKIYSKTVVREPEKSLKLIINHIRGLSLHFKLIILDSPSVYLTRVDPMIKMDFLQTCKEMCGKDRTLVLAVDSSSLENKALHRTSQMSDYYLKLKNHDRVLETGQEDTRIIKIMEVSRLAGADRWGSSIRFEIKPRVGIQMLPFMRVRI